MPLRRPAAGSSLLSPSGYDDDVSSLRSVSEQDTDSDDEILQRSRNTLELAQHDRTVLEEEEELEKLLTRSGPAQGLRRIFSGGHDNASSIRIGKRERRRQRRRDRKAARRSRMRKSEEEGDLMFEMEEGYRDDSLSPSPTPSSELDRRAFDNLGHRKSKGALFRRLIVVLAAIAVLFAILLLGAYKASGDFRAHRRRPLLSNGTSLFAPTTIYLSLDGFRADFLDRGLTPALNSFVANGISPLYMRPSFPSVTFPNHFTLVTGLYPESHGVVGNSFWDPETDEEFYYTNTAVSMQPKWWKAEPIWVTAENQGVKTAIHMWPGSEAHIGNVEPSYVDKYNGSEILPRKVDRILQFLDLPGEEDDDTSDDETRPQLIAAYVPNVDADGHKYGPNSTEIQTTISKVDGMLGSLLQGLAERNLTDIVNVVVVSDHGMATTSEDRLVQLEDLVDLDLVAHIEGWPSRGLRPKRPEDLPVLEKQLMDSAKKYADGIEVYTLDTMPAQYHFTQNDRIAPLWAIPKTGWAIVEYSDYNIAEDRPKRKAFHPKGIHGYNHEDPLMRAIFMAHGPSFPHQPNSRVEPFQNIEVYNILCDSLGIQPRPNNGTLRLPLKPVGLHSDPEAPEMAIPSHPPVTRPQVLPKPTSTAVVPSTTPDVPAIAPTDGPDDENKSEESGSEELSSGDSFWNTLLNSLDRFKDWASGVINKVGGDH